MAIDPVSAVKIASIAIPAIGSLFGRRKKGPSPQEQAMKQLQPLQMGLGRQFNQAQSTLGRVAPQYNTQLYNTVAGLQRDPYRANQADSLLGRGISQANSQMAGTQSRVLGQLGRAGLLDSSRGAGITAAIQALTMGQIGNLANKLNIARADQTQRNNLQATQLLGNERSYQQNLANGSRAAQLQTLLQMAGLGTQNDMLSEQRRQFDRGNQANLFGTLGQLAVDLFGKGK